MRLVRINIKKGHIKTTMNKHTSGFRLRVSDSAAILSALLFYFGFGLHPLPLLTWLILVPLLIVAPRISARRTIMLSVVASVLGQIGMSVYFANTLQMPPALLVVLIVYITAVMVGTVSLGRLFFIRRQPLLAIVAVGSLWVTGEYLLTLLAPHGSWWSLGYTQSAFLTLFQVVSVTGIWGISFLLTAFSAALAAMVLPSTAARTKTGIALLAIGLAVLIGGFGTFRLHQPDNSTKLKVASAVVAQPSEEVPAVDPAGKAILSAYQRDMQRLSAQHVKAVVFPEKGLRATHEQIAPIVKQLATTAQQYHITAVVGVMVQTGAETYENQAIIVTPDQGEATYVKQHLIPGLESDFDEGNTLGSVPGSNHLQGVIICKDLDFQTFVRSYRQAGASILLAPAWDFNNDGWLHSRIAITRGVENGMSIVRTGRDGQLTISDAKGRVLAEQQARENTASSITADVPTSSLSTLYTKFGDWLAYACIAITLGCSGYLFVKRKSHEV